MAIYISKNVQDAMIQGKIGAYQSAKIMEAVNKFSAANHAEDAEIVFIDNAAYGNLLTASSGVDSRRVGFYSDGSPKIWIATSWRNNCNGKNGPKIFMGQQGNMTEWVSLRTYCDK